MKDQLQSAVSKANGPIKRELKVKCKELGLSPTSSHSADGNSDSDDHVPHTAPDMREFVCGSGAASINICLTFPLNKVMFRQQLLGISTKSAVMQLKKEGYFHLYRGVLPPLIHKSASLAIMFGMYDKFQLVLATNIHDLPDIANKSMSAMLAGVAEGVFVPLERVQTLLQNKQYHQHYRNTLHALMELRSHGVNEYYRGMVPILLRNGPSNALFFLLRGPVKELLPESHSSSGELMKNFASGGVLGAGISTAFFPVNVVKTRMQSTVGGPFPGFFASFLLVYKDRNYSVRQLFRGVSVNFTRSMLSWGIINASYELLKNQMYPPVDS